MRILPSDLRSHAPGGLQKLVGCAVMIALVWTVSAANARAAVIYSRGKAIDLTVSATRVLIELDGTRPMSQVALGLASAGFPSTAKVTDTALQLPYQWVYVNSTDAGTLAAIRAVPGIRAVRKAYTPPYFDKPLILNGKVTVKFRPGTTAADVATFAAQNNATVERQLAGLDNVYSLRVADEAIEDSVDVAARLHQLPAVLYSYPSMLMRELIKPNLAPIEDVLYPYQWHLRNTGQLSESLVGADINVLPAWDITMGDGAIVGVVDGSFDIDHEDLAPNYLNGYDFELDEGSPRPKWPSDISDPGAEGHGTAVAGIICAADNNVGVRGVAPHASFVAARIGYVMPTDQDFADSLTFCEANGASVINNSWGTGFVLLPTVPTADIMLPDVVSDAIVTVSTKGRSGLGVLVTFSSGNDAMLIPFGNIYASVDQVMAVGATMRDDTLSCYSDYGNEQSVVAPGGGVLGECMDSDIATTDITDGMYPNSFLGMDVFIRGFNQPTRYVGGMEVPDSTILDFPQLNYTHHMNGTSSACPMVSGVAALVFSVNPGLTAREARNLIEHTAKKIQAPNVHFDAVTGHNIYYGHGRVDAYQAVLAAQAAKSWPMPVKDIQNVSSQALARILWSQPDWDADGVADEDVVGNLVVRGPLGQLNWAPVDGIVYTVGQQVAPGVIVVANDLITSLDQTGLPMGDFEYAIFVRNAANYYSWGRRTSFSSSGSVTVPLASIQASVTSGHAPLSVHFAGGAIDESGIASLSWTFGDGQAASGATTDHTYNIPGRYTVTLRVTNTVGQTAQTTQVINVLSGTNAVPVASITATPLSGEAPLAVLLAATASDADGQIVRYDWSFGDGSVATGQTVEHIYLDPGTYGVTLTAIDNSGGEGMASVLITVTSSTTTAAQTVTSDAAQTLVSTCGAGAGSAVMVASLGLCGLMALRRRRW